MITHTFCQMMAQYNEWMNSRLYALCATLPEADLHKDRGAFFKSIYLTLNHIAYVDPDFLSRFTGNPAAVPEPDADLCRSFTRLRKEREALDARLLTWTASLEPHWLAESHTDTSTDGKIRTVPRWALVSHMFNHQTHYRGQITMLLSQKGLDIGTTDIPYMPRCEHDA